MTREELLTKLWCETNLLVLPHRPEGHDGKDSCLCRWCAVSSTLRELDEKFGMTLAKEQASARR